MARTKTYNLKTFTFTVNGETFSFYCETTNTRSGFCHHAYLWGLGYHGEHTRVSYYNRTWESFGYETVMRRAVEKITPKAIRPAIHLELDAITMREHEKCEAFLKAFTADYSKLSSEQKQFVADHTPEITNRDQADAVHSTVKLMGLLTA